MDYFLQFKTASTLNKTYKLTDVQEKIMMKKMLQTKSLINAYAHLCRMVLWMVIFLLTACTSLSTEDSRDSARSAYSSKPVQAEPAQDASVKEPVPAQKQSTQDARSDSLPDTTSGLKTTSSSPPAQSTAPGKRPQTPKKEASTKAPVVSKKVISETDKRERPDKSNQAMQEPAHDKANPELAAASEKPLDAQVTLESLPLIIGENWVLNREPDSSGRCALFYREQVMQDGQGETTVRLMISSNEMIFKTRSNIDLSYEQTGIRLDQQAQIPIEQVLNETDIRYAKNIQEVLRKMQTAEHLTLSLGFWPTWPVTRTHQLDFDISDFSLAFNKLKTCATLEKGLH